jgi:hypothetical protein
MLAWWALAWPVVAVPHAAAAWQAWRERNQLPEQAPDEPTSMRTLMAMGVVFMTALLAPPSFALVSGQGRGDGPSMVSETPLYLADEVARRGLTGNIAVPMDWADYLVWKTDGRLKPLVYSHVHLADPAAWEDHKRLFTGDPKWLALLDAHQMKYVAASRQRSPELAKAVLLDSRGDNPRVRILYQDQRCLLAEVLPAEKAK